jgi:hypothetical protein
MLTHTVDMYVVSNLVPEVVHELIKYITVLFDHIVHFQEDIHSKSLHCDYGRSSRLYRVQQLATLTIFFL